MTVVAYGPISIQDTDSMSWVIVVFIASQQSDAPPVIQCFNVINLFLVCSYAACPGHFDVNAETEKYAQKMRLIQLEHTS